MANMEMEILKSPAGAAFPGPLQSQAELERKMAEVLRSLQVCPVCGFDRKVVDGRGYVCARCERKSK